jgi:ferredoxin
MRLDVDRDRCEGHGVCAMTAPTLIHLDDDDQPQFEHEMAPADAELARVAASVCPVTALRLLI